MVLEVRTWDQELGEVYTVLACNHGVSRKGVVITNRELEHR